MTQEIFDCLVEKIKDKSKPLTVRQKIGRRLQKWHKQRKNSQLESAPAFWEQTETFPIDYLPQKEETSPLLKRAD